MTAQPGARIDPRDPQQRAGVSQAREWIAEASPQHLARIAGGLYVIIIVAGFFAIGWVSATIIVPGDAAATAHNILAHELLYRLGLMAHIIILPCNIVLALIFYDLFKVVSRRLALLVVFFTLVGTAVEGANLLDQFAPLRLLGGGHYLSVFTTEQLQALAYMPLASQTIGYDIQQVIYAGYLIVAGYLIFRSTFLPRAVGVLLAIGGLCYLIYSFAGFLAPEFAAGLVPYIQVPSGVAELSLCLWLLVMGVNVERWEKRLRETA
jgi:uncharacterized protein DUF4386